MSPSRKSAGRKGPRKSHALRRHSPKAVRASNPPAPARSFVRHIIALEAIGWRIVELRPSVVGDEAPLWHVAITRVDLDASMAVAEVDLDIALAELVRYASADATEER